MSYYWRVFILLIKQEIHFLDLAYVLREKPDAVCTANGSIALTDLVMGDEWTIEEEIAWAEFESQLALELEAQKIKYSGLN